jgi:hypothetical protein
MTNKETTTRNIGLTFDFVNHLIDNPSLIESLPDKFQLNFVESDFKIVSSQKPRRKSKKAVTERYVKVKNTFELPG